MIAAAVMTSVPLGISTAIAVAAHEIPQEVGDFAILLHAGYSRRRALLLNVLSGVSGLAGGRWRRSRVDPLPNMLPYFLLASPPPASSTSRCRTSSPTCTKATWTPARSASCCSSLLG